MENTVFRFKINHTKRRIGLTSFRRCVFVVVIVMRFAAGLCMLKTTTISRDSTESASCKCSLCVCSVCVCVTVWNCNMLYGTLGCGECRKKLIRHIAT